MKNWERWLIYSLLGIQSLFITVVLCRWYPRVVCFQNLNFDYLGLIVGILALLVTVLLGWQIFSVIGLESRVRNMMYEKLDMYNAANEKKLAAQQTELLTAIMMTQLEVKNIDMILILASYIPGQMKRADAVSDMNLSIEINKIESAIESIRKKPSSYSLNKVFEAFKEFAGFPSVYSFLKRIEMMQCNPNNSDS